MPRPKTPAASTSSYHPSRSDTADSALADTSTATIPAPAPRPKKRKRVEEEAAASPEAAIEAPVDRKAERRARRAQELADLRGAQSSRRDGADAPARAEAAETALEQKQSQL